MKRALTEIEKQFVKEANDGGFSVDYDEEGAPYALGADKTGHLFSMDVVETPERAYGGSCYTLK